VPYELLDDVFLVFDHGHPDTSHLRVLHRITTYKDLSSEDPHTIPATRNIALALLANAI
jgi:hypothetical protein